MFLSLWKFAFKWTWLSCCNTEVVDLYIVNVQFVDIVMMLWLTKINTMLFKILLSQIWERYFCYLTDMYWGGFCAALCVMLLRSWMLSQECLLHWWILWIKYWLEHILQVYFCENECHCLMPTFAYAVS